MTDITELAALTLSAHNARRSFEGFADRMALLFTDEGWGVCINHYEPDSYHPSPEAALRAYIASRAKDASKAIDIARSDLERCEQLARHMEDIISKAR